MRVSHTINVLNHIAIVYLEWICQKGWHCCPNKNGWKVERSVVSTTWHWQLISALFFDSDWRRGLPVACSPGAGCADMIIATQLEKFRKKNKNETISLLVKKKDNFQERFLKRILKSLCVWKEFVTILEILTMHTNLDTCILLHENSWYYFCSQGISVTLWNR